MKKILVLGTFFLLNLIKLNAQSIDSIGVTKESVPNFSKYNRPIDSIELAKNKKWKPIPKRALLYSIIPAAGQIYNRKLWYIKVPIVLGAFGFGINRIVVNSREYRNLRDNYYNKVNGLPLDLSIYPNIEKASPEFILAGRNSADQAMQQSYVLTTVLYLLSGIEAFTAAHLANFDVSENLSLRLKPSFETLPLGGNNVGFGVAFCFK